jgi:nicotinamide N-methyltransferase
LYRGRFVLELGAGGGLPGIVVAKNGAKKVLSPPSVTALNIIM